MAQKDYYKIKKNVDKVVSGRCTYFLDPKSFKEIKSKLKGYDYKVYYPYKDSEKVIIYIDEEPNIKVYEIISFDELKHREILGSLYGLNLDDETFGDIIIKDNHYYIMIIENVENIIESELKTIGNKGVKLKEVQLDDIKDYERKYEEIEFIVSSLRIDTLVSKIVKTSRDNVKKIFKDGLVILNYEKIKRTNYLLNENDIFSIRKYGKYKYVGIIKGTKKGGYIIKCLKYVDN